MKNDGAWVCEDLLDMDEAVYGGLRRNVDGGLKRVVGKEWKRWKKSSAGRKRYEMRRGRSHF